MAAEELLPIDIHYNKLLGERTAITVYLASSVLLRLASGQKALQLKMAAATQSERRWRQLSMNCHKMLERLPARAVSNMPPLLTHSLSLLS